MLELQGVKMQKHQGVLLPKQRGLFALFLA